MGPTPERSQGKLHSYELEEIKTQISSQAVWRQNDEQTRQPPLPILDPPREGEDEGEGDRRTPIPDKDHDDKTKPEVARTNLFSAAR